MIRSRAEEKLLGRFCELRNRALRGRAQAISSLVRRKDVASANSLGASAMNDRRPGEQRITLDGPQVVDLEL